MPRLFTGIELPEEVSEHLAMQRGGVHGARWIDPANYHITLRFMGDIDADIACDVAELLDGVRRKPFTLRLDGLGVFGGDRPRALYAAVAPCAALNELQAEHERLVRRAGLPAETRKFTPHVTLARLRDTSPRLLADYLSMRGHFRSMSFEVERFVLFSSRSGTGGGPYLVEEAYPLAPAVEGSKHAALETVR